MSTDFDDDLYPGSAVVFIRSTWGSETVTGTGFLVGRNDVLTASHVIYNQALGGLADQVEVIPSYDPTDTFDEPVYSPVNFNYFSNFDPDGDGRISAGDNRFDTQGGVELDIALLSMDVPLGDQYGWFDIDYQHDGGDVAVLGHPGTNDKRLTHDTGTAYLDAVDDTFNISLDLDINAGNSGGPIYYTTAEGSFAVGIVSTRFTASEIGGHESWLAPAMVENDRFLADWSNRAPTANADTYSTASGGSLAITSLAGLLANDTDLDGDLLRVESYDYRGSGSLTILQDGSFTYTPAAAFSGTDTFTYTVSDGNSGADTATVEIAVLAPGSTADVIARYYNHILMRDATDAELDSFSALVDSGAMTLTEVRDALVTSSEAVTFVDQVIRLYQAAFNRVPDAAGINGWVDGLVDGSLDLYAAAAGFTNSAEFLNLYGTNSVSTGYLVVLYQNVLGRASTSQEVDAWIATGQDAHEILIGFSNSQEFQNRSASAVENLKKQAADAQTLSSVYDGAAPLLADRSMAAATPYPDEETANSPAMLMSVAEEFAPDVALVGMNDDPADPLI